MAKEVIHEMRKQKGQLVDEATMVSRELMRVAMTPHEVWHDGLELAAQQYMEFKDTDSMLKTLISLHDALEVLLASITLQSGFISCHPLVFSYVFKSTGKDARGYQYRWLY
jgi:hypothetical protein